MKLINKKLSLVYLSALVMCGSCSDDIVVKDIDTGKYEGATQQLVYLQNAKNARSYEVVDLFGQEQTASLYAGLTKPAAKNIACKLAIDTAVLAIYNKEHDTQFKLCPLGAIELPKAGEVIIEKGEIKSPVLEMKVKRVDGLKVGETYALPVTISVENAEVVSSTSKKSYVYLIKVQPASVDPSKDSGIVTVMYFEVNDTNPLNAAEWILKKSGKPLADVVCLFAANINFNVETGRPFVLFNENVTAILNNRNKYIKPLQDKGIKVTLSILGNHDKVGVANLGDATAKEFARELKAIVDAYQLDGIEFDDEYSNYGLAAGTPGLLARPSEDAYARLVYETKKIMPDKLVSVYHYGHVGFEHPIDGVDPGEFIDYTYEAFYSYLNSGIWSSYKGMTKKQNAPYSRKIYYGLSFSPSSLQVVRDEYGVNMLYNYNIKQISNYVRKFSEMTQVLYDDECIFTGIVHNKDWN